jgi:DNA processing protein
MSDLFSTLSSPPQAIPLTDQQKLDWIRLARSENVGAVTFRHLIERYRTPSKALEAVSSLALKGGSKRAITICPLDLAEQEMNAAQTFGATFVPLGSTDYPAILAQIHDPPPFLWIKGRVNLLSQKCVGIVGARNASAAGARFSAQISRELSYHGYCVVSGLARGIDAAAHESVLNSNGMTVGVVAGGVDVIWPSETKHLAHRMWEEGVCISEMPMGEQPRNRHFPRRNRIIAGVSQGIVLVEAAEKSGSLITAQYALEQGREILAIPGSPLDARAAGCNALIRNGATLTRNIDDILDALAHWKAPQTAREPEKEFTHAPPSDDAIENARPTVLNLLSPTPTLLDDIIVQSGIAIPIVQTILLELDLAGRLERHHGGYVSLIA